MQTPIGISNRHLHLSVSDADVLFGKGYEFKKLKDLSQPGQYACMETVTIQGLKGKIENVRVLGPARPQTQIEILQGDTFVLGVDAPLRLSGDLKDTPGLKVTGPMGSVDLPGGVIVAQRHLHIDLETAQKWNLQNGQIIQIEIDGPRGTIYDNVSVRANKDFVLDCHLDVEEGNASGIKGMGVGTIER